MAIGDHPRVCGEKGSVRLLARAFQGSPPRMRGKALRGIQHPRSLRDHPRVCGEKNRSLTDTEQAEGSPPRMRGKVGFAFLHTFAVGITPAYAGKSLAFCAALRALKDHPRVCGEKINRIFHNDLHVGSPPRMRGKVRKHISTPSTHRITPAYAGKRGCPLRARTVPEDHPRVCGEKKAITSGSYL